jgi:hypothetical protein
MADLNTRQNSFLQKLQTKANELVNLYGDFYELSQSYAEEFAAAQDNDLATANNLVATYGFDSADVAAAVNQGLLGFINFWVGNAVTTREYGKDLRRVSAE